jgi:uncharacterized protein (DUF433 family)
MDWLDCPNVEITAVKVSGQPLLKGTRVQEICPEQVQELNLQ